MINNLQLDGCLLRAIDPLAYLKKRLIFLSQYHHLISIGIRAANFNGNLVSSDLMKDKLLTFHTFIKPKQIKVLEFSMFESFDLTL